MVSLSSSQKFYKWCLIANHCCFYRIFSDFPAGLEKVNDTLQEKAWLVPVDFIFDFSVSAWNVSNWFPRVILIFFWGSSSWIMFYLFNSPDDLMGVILWIKQGSNSNRHSNEKHGLNIKKYETGATLDWKFESNQCYALTIRLSSAPYSECRHILRQQKLQR